MRIRQIKPELFDAEFRGLFLGEGCVDIVRSGKADHHLTVRLRVGMNERELPMLTAIQSHYGGSLDYRAATRSWTWTLSGAKRAVPVIAMLLDASLPSAKLAELSLALTALDPGADRFEVKAALSRLKRAV